MIKSLYSGVTGMKVHNQRMDVIGNNIANVNTTAYKGSAVTFKDIYYQTKQSASAGTVTQGGKNPIQTGYGAATSTVNQVMTQSGFTYSDTVWDCALTGEGFFQVMDQAGNIFYTRNGNFTIDNAGNLSDPNGYIVLGTIGDPTGIPANQQRISIIIPPVDNNVASATKTVLQDYDMTFEAAGYGPEGNISITIQHAELPFSTLNGSNLNVMLDLNQKFETQDDFQAAVNDAIREGGVDLGDGVIPLSIRFSSVPAEVDAKTASNIMEFKRTEGEGEDMETFKMYLQFDSVEAGAYANKYEINMKCSSTATGVTAKWVNNVLTITVPGKAEYGEDEEIPNITIEDIQKAIDIAAGAVVDEDGEIIEDEPFAYPKKRLIVTDEIEIEGYDDNEGLDGWNIYGSIGTNTKRMGMKGAADSFYNEVASSVGTVKLEDGRFAAEQSYQDLETVFVDSDGTIYGEHAVHGRMLLGRIDIVTFENPIGLNQVGTSYWTESLSSGEAELKIAGTDGCGEIASGALEMSNVDLSQEFSDMIITQRGFQANSRIITVSDTLLEELINLKR